MGGDAPRYVLTAFCVGIKSSDGVDPPNVTSEEISAPNVIACPELFPI